MEGEKNAQAAKLRHADGRLDRFDHVHNISEFARAVASVAD